MATIQTTRKIAAYLGVSAMTITNWRRHMGLPAPLIGSGRHKRLVTTTDAITTWLASLNDAQQTLRRIRIQDQASDNPK